MAFFLLTKEEEELIEAIRDSKNPAEAILAAVQIITDFLKQPLSLKGPEDEIPPEQGEKV